MFILYPFRKTELPSVYVYYNGAIHKASEVARIMHILIYETILIPVTFTYRSIYYCDLFYIFLNQ